MNELYDKFRYFYMENMTTAETLNRLAEAGKLSFDEVEKIIKDRQELKGF